MHLQQNLDNRLIGLDSLFYNNPDAVYSFDIHGRFVEGNSACTWLSGYELSELVGRSFYDIVAEAQVQQTAAIFESTLAGVSSTYETSIRHKQGHLVEVLVTTMPIKIGDQIVGTYGIAKDITEIKRAQRLVDGQRTVFEMIIGGDGVRDTLDEIVAVMESLSEESVGAIWKFDAPGHRLVHAGGKNISQDIVHYIQNEFRLELRGGVMGKAIDSGEAVIVKDTENDPLWRHHLGMARTAGIRALWAKPFFDSKGLVIGCASMYFPSPREPGPHELKVLDTFVNLVELTIRNEQQTDDILHLAFTDSLTGIANRRKFYDVLSTHLREDDDVGIMFLDLDRFKLFNDTLGHEFGDEILRRTVQSIRTCLPPEAVLARMGGDEFTILLPGYASEEQVMEIATRVLQKTSEPVELEGYPVQITTSMGIAFAPRDGKDISTIMKNVDTAMYAAKQMGRDRFAFYHPEMNAKHLEILTLESSMRDALNRTEFFVEYQPKIDIHKNKIVGAEALVRWRHPKEGVLLPGRFIPIAEETGLISSIGLWVLQDVCQTVKRWQDSGMPEMNVAINISGVELVRPNSVQRIMDVIEKTQVDPSWLEFEITETTLIKDGDIVKLAIQHFKRHGITIALDDFGTGYSSLGVLTQYDIDTLKIDHAFTSGILAKDAKYESVIVAMITLAHSMDMKVVAEGVETKYQQAFLTDQGCDVMQGFLFSPAVAADVLETLIRNGR
ncbi:EAL domain-containing protein [Alicyclobacillus fastidiosus]|uniref:EAL domain-containing protein n=1 Tax=Alicyclobacillus fastidiosus TaxID=392011 RepID=A0ABY6ZDM7_9BACL|nr:EAL domain-containing protein [Alicyclobacillus fastidiosus]WAH40241.1 EAL domain-containing protein [Alicyclobacillus fastidiosus]GMA61606.1 bifunctional diguanylate cyclase/phosphodiesterase [Alicyclobacillus fastidiosus]